MEKMTKSEFSLKLAEILKTIDKGDEIIFNNKLNIYKITKIK